jgi:5'-3' exonuclease
MRLHLVDGTFELFRAHFSRRPPRRDREGRDSRATVGMAESLLALLRDPAEGVTHLAVAFDNPIRSFRNELFEGYKTEEGMPPELLAQRGPAEDAVRALGIVTWPMDRFEADDALATAASLHAGAVEQVRILTPDKDLGQCIVGRRVVQVDRIRGVEIDEEALRARRGIGPGSVPDLLALTGDAADGIPGLPGFGEKTAGALLGRFIHLEDVPGDAAAWPAAIRGAPRLSAVLEARRDEALLYRRLATLVRDVPLAETLDDLRWRGLPRERFESWCEVAGAGHLRRAPHPSPR